MSESEAYALDAAATRPTGGRDVSDKYEAIVTAECVSQTAKAIADVIGHGMREKCEVMANVALRASGLPAEIARLRAEVERLNLELASMHNWIEQYEPAKYSTETGK